eukprot:SAG22_NODE_133_length_18379_cov_34.571937_10_plen_197_part_00
MYVVVEPAVDMAVRKAATDAIDRQPSLLTDTSRIRQVFEKIDTDGSVRQRSSLLKAVITAFPSVSLPFLAVPLLPLLSHRGPLQGEIDRWELSKLLGGIGYTAIGESVAATIIEEMDSDGDGQITFKEFDNWWKQMKVDQYRRMNDEHLLGPQGGSSGGGGGGGGGGDEIASEVKELRQQVSQLQATVDKLVQGLK